MKMRSIAAVAGTVFLLGAGSAMAWDLHDTLAPATNATPVTSQAVPAGADLRIPGSNGNVSVGGAVYDYQCADAKANAAPNSAEVATFCAPGDR